MITEDQLEQLCLDWFKYIGYDYVCGYDIAPDKVNGEAREGALGYGDSPERTVYGQVVLFNRHLAMNLNG